MEFEDNTAQATPSAYLDVATAAVPRIPAARPAPRDSAPTQESGSRAVLYLRVSSAGQVKTDYDPEGISIPAQRVACERKAGQLNLEIIDEYVEPGRSGTEMTKRIAFQELLERIRRTRDIDYVIVYELSRLARNRIDDAIVMADLRKRGVTLISATESVDETPVGQLMHGILAAFNEYRSAKDGADIAYKMGEKAKKGGTLGRAPLGYLNIIDRTEGREIRTIKIDDQRAPLIRQAFEMYATGQMSMADITEELTILGLTSRVSHQRPAKPIEAKELSRMLRNPYYCGFVTYKGELFAGRHPSIISQELFDSVQQVLEVRGVAGERRRTHHHYLKGSLFCGHCDTIRNTDRRMILLQATGRHGNKYNYFFCRGLQDSTCSSSHCNTDRIEVAVEDHYKTIAFSPQFIETMRAAVAATVADNQTSQRLAKADLATKLRELDQQEERLLDLAADGTLPPGKIRARINGLQRKRTALSARLETVTNDLTAGAAFIDTCLELMSNPYELYLKASDDTRRQLNQAIFHRLYVYQDDVTRHELRPELQQLRTIQDDWATDAQPTNTKSTAKDGGSCVQESRSRTRGIEELDVSSKTHMVELRGFEPLTPTLPVWCATNCAIAPDCCAHRSYTTTRCRSKSQVTGIPRQLPGPVGAPRSARAAPGAGFPGRTPSRCMPPRG